MTAAGLLTNARFEVLPEERLCRTVFEDGLVVPATPNRDAESVDRARSLGYEGSDEAVLWAMTREHDLLHSILAEAEGWPWSPTLRGVASGYSVPAGQSDREERLALCVARLLNHVRKTGELLA